MTSQEIGVFNYLKAVLKIKFKSCTIESVDVKTILNLIEKQQKEIEDLKDFNTKLQATKDRLDIYDKENTLEIEKLKKEIVELKHFKEEVIDIIKYADDTAEPTYWNIRKLLGLGE